MLKDRQKRLQSRVLWSPKQNSSLDVTYRNLTLPFGLLRLFLFFRTYLLKTLLGSNFFLRPFCFVFKSGSVSCNPSLSYISFVLIFLYFCRLGILPICFWIFRRFWFRSSCLSFSSCAFFSFSSCSSICFLLRYSWFQIYAFQRASWLPLEFLGSSLSSFFFCNFLMD